MYKKKRKECVYLPYPGVGGGVGAHEDPDGALAFPDAEDGAKMFEVSFWICAEFKIEADDDDDDSIDGIDTFSFCGC
jgi:hypothetical protein